MTLKWLYGPEKLTGLSRNGPQDRAVCVRALLGDLVLGSSTRHLTLTVPLSTRVYRGVYRASTEF